MTEIEHFKSNFNMDDLEISPTTVNDIVSSEETKKDIVKVLKRENRLSNEEIELKQKLILKITRYLESSRFKSYLSSLGLHHSSKTLQSLSINDLEERLEEIKVAVSNKNMTNLISELTFTITSVGETLTQTPKIRDTINLNGLTKSLKEDDGFLDTLEQLHLEYSDISYLSAEKKMVYLLMSHSFKINA